MCGIAGSVDSGSSLFVEYALREMPHRGPDRSAIWRSNDGRVELGHVRLSIVDLNHGHQPMVSRCGNYILIFNGEIYNHQLLREQLEKAGSIFDGFNSDTEVLLNGYIKWGAAVVDKLNGMWAFAIYDKVNNIIFCSRDRFGKKPFYYEHSKGFRFSSEMVPSFRQGQKISSDSLLKYFGYGFVPGVDTLYKGIKKLDAGHNLIYDLVQNSTQLIRYWRYQNTPEHQIGSLDFLKEELLEKLEAAVKIRMLADVPVGTFLSGGLDSTLVTYFASKECNGDLKSFSIGFEDKSFDESNYSRFAADFCRTEHYSAIFSEEKFLELLTTVIDKVDEPFADSSFLPTYLVSQLASKQVTVVLGGDGADELCAGYDPFRALRIASYFDRYNLKRTVDLANKISATLRVSHSNMSFDFKVKRFLSGLSVDPSYRLPVWMQPCSIEKAGLLTGLHATEEQVYEEAIKDWNESSGTDLVSRSIEYYVNFYLKSGILSKLDRATMLNSIEGRTPFLDIDFVNFISRLPSIYKLKGMQTKYLLKNAAENVIPREIIYRKKKGFGIPIGRWFQDGKISINFNKLPAEINSKEAKKLLADHRAGAADNRLILWALKMIEGR